MRRTERAAYRTKFYSNLSSPTQFDEEPNKKVTKEEAAFENSQTAVYSQFLRSHNRYRYEGFRNRFNLSPIGLPFVSLFIIYFLFQTMD